MHQTASTAAAEARLFFACFSDLQAGLRAGDEKAIHDSLLELSGFALHAISPPIRRRAARTWTSLNGDKRLADYEPHSVKLAISGLAMAEQYGDRDQLDCYLASLEELADQATDPKSQKAARATVDACRRRIAIRKAQRATSVPASIPTQGVEK